MRGKGGLKPTVLCTPPDLPRVPNCLLTGIIRQAWPPSADSPCFSAWRWPRWPPMARSCCFPTTQRLPAPPPRCLRPQARSMSARKPCTTGRRQVLAHPRAHAYAGCGRLLAAPAGLLPQRRQRPQVWPARSMHPALAPPSGSATATAAASVPDRLRLLLPNLHRPRLQSSPAARYWQSTTALTPPCPPATASASRATGLPSLRWQVGRERAINMRMEPALPRPSAAVRLPEQMATAKQAELHQGCQALHSASPLSEPAHSCLLLCR